MYGKGALALTFCTSQNMTFLIDHVLRVYKVNDLYLCKPSIKDTWQSTTTINQKKYYPSLITPYEDHGSGVPGCNTAPIIKQYISWWRHPMGTFSALLAICAGNSPVPGELPTQRPVTRSFDVFFDLRPNKRLSKQWWGSWFEMQSFPLWRHRNVLQITYADGYRWYLSEFKA